MALWQALAMLSTGPSDAKSNVSHEAGCNYCATGQVLHISEHAGLDETFGASVGSQQPVAFLFWCFLKVRPNNGGYPNSDTLLVEYLYHHCIGRKAFPTLGNQVRDGFRWNLRHMTMISHSVSTPASLEYSKHAQGY
jgi:hypothetical protein